MQLEDCCAPYFEYHPSQRSLESGGEVATTKDPNLEELLELGPEVTCFFRGSAESLEEENKRAPSQASSGKVMKVGDMEGWSLQNT